MEDYVDNVSEEVDMPSNRATDGESVCIERLDVPSQNDVLDCRDAFTTSEVFSTRDDLLNWARKVGKENGFIVVIIRSDTRAKGRKTKLTLGCARGGKYRPYKNENEIARKVVGTKKCGCPFKLKGMHLKNGEGWKLNVVCGFHNHEVVKGDAYASRLSGEEKSLIGDLTKNMVKPRDILLTLKDHDQDITIKQVYNARQAFRVSQKGPITEMQHLMNLMERDHYVYLERRDDKSDAVRDIFWAHPDAVKLLNVFHIVLIIDSTYMTNKYRLPLVEIVGVTSTDLTFTVAFAYLESKRADDFAWALQKLSVLFLKDDAIPQVIVTDKDISLMNAVQSVFPSSTQLFCQSHITKNVKAKCKLLVHSKEKWDPVMDAWDSIMNSPNEDEYQKRLRKLEDVCSDFPIFSDYVKNTWLIPYKEKIVATWIDRVMHLGNARTSRIESEHGSLKKLLQDSGGDLCNCWDAMNTMIVLQHNEIKTSFRKSINAVEHKFYNRFYLKLRGFVSSSALNRIADEYERVKIVGLDHSICGCTARTAYGLPCACELARYSMMGNFLPLQSVHPHWKMLSFVDYESPSELSLQPAIDALLKRFQELDVPGKMTMKIKLRELLFPDANSVCDD